MGTVSAHNTKIPSRGKALVDTDIQMMIPVDTCEFFLSFSLCR